MREKRFETVTRIYSADGVRHSEYNCGTHNIASPSGYCQGTMYTAFAKYSNKDYNML